MFNNFKIYGEVHIGMGIFTGEKNTSIILLVIIDTYYYKVVMTWKKVNIKNLWSRTVRCRFLNDNKLVVRSRYIKCYDDYRMLPSFNVPTKPTDCIPYRLIYCINFRTNKTRVYASTWLYIVVPINCQNPFILLLFR